MTVPFLDLKTINLQNIDAMRQAFDRVMNSGWYILGEEVRQFEREYAEYCGAAAAVGVANGLDALILALKALGVGEGDEVLVPSNTYIATWLAVSHVGAKPVPVEPDPGTYNLDPERLADALTPKTRAVMPVHLYGRPADLDSILAFAGKHGLVVVEDGAQCHGARYKGRRIGSHGDAVAWSYYPGKNLGAIGDGGAVTTNRDDVATRLRVLRNYGSQVKYHNEVIGWNSRLDELQAALLRAKLPRLDAENTRRSEIAATYQRGLEGLEQIGLTLPRFDADYESAWHLYVVRHPRRDELAERLRDRGIGTVIHYPIPPHLQPAYRQLGIFEGQLPLSEQLHRTVLSLPLGPTQTAEQTAEVIEAVSASVRELAS